MEGRHDRDPLCGRTIVGFQHEHKVRAFLDDLKEDTDGFRSDDPDLAFIALSID
jgi:hypothetical protein